MQLLLQEEPQLGSLLAQSLPHRLWDSGQEPQHLWVQQGRRENVSVTKR